MPLGQISPLLPQCTVTALCYLRSAWLWAIVAVVLLFRAVLPRASKREQSVGFVGLVGEMASSVGSSRVLARVALPAVVSGAAYGFYKLNGSAALKHFLFGPGKYSRLLALFVVLFNWKSLPFAWTFRVWYGMLTHLFVRPFHTHGPDKLFAPVRTKTHTSILEVDYNFHKSNSTYFADLDVSRTHLVSHLLSRGLHVAANNQKTKAVMDPANPSKPAAGKFNIMLGSVHCSFKKEIKPLQGYEMWSSILAWDRKWMYIVTHFVEKGAGVARNGKPVQFPEKKLFATAVSKYVFKIGRLTVHPAVVIGKSGMLPERPGGWVTVENGMAQPAETVTGGELEEADSSTAWDWRRTQRELEKGLEFAEKFAAIDGLHDRFDADQDGTLGVFPIG